MNIAIPTLPADLWTFQGFPQRSPGQLWEGLRGVCVTVIKKTRLDTHVTCNHHVMNWSQELPFYVSVCKDVIPAKDKARYHCHLG